MAELATEKYVDWYGKGRSQNWRTPRVFFSTLDDEFLFNLDGASEAYNSLCSEGSTPEAPISWYGRRVFCNPPWSDIASFVELGPFAELAVLLVPARTNARWFHRALELGAEPRFFLKRLRFELPDGSTRHGSPVDCLLLIWDNG